MDVEIGEEQRQKNARTKEKKTKKQRVDLREKFCENTQRKRGKLESPSFIFFLHFTAC